LASSANIYGNACSGIISEASPPQPANDYGITKLAVEELAKLYADRLPIIVTRPFNYTGLGQSSKYIVPKIVEHVRLRAERLEIGNIDVQRDFSDVRAVAEVYAQLTETPAATSGTFNICSGRAVSLRHIIDTACQLAGHSMEVVINPDFVRANEVRSLCGNPERLEALIGPIRMPPLEDTLRWMLEA
jgi:nucleoside-diphosphate-sugar epimerase